MPTATGPLHGIRILDLGSIVMAPYATQMLGDLGADVIKVESFDGDQVRQAGAAKHPGMGAVFLTLGRNKRSIALDLRKPAAREVVRRLVAQSDVVVHNMRPDATRRLELDYASLRAVKDDIVYCAARGFRSTGPYRDLPALDDMIQGLSGTADVLGRLFGEPAYVPMIYVDKTVGVFVANAILAALVHRLRTGRGQEVEVPMFEVTTAFTLVEHLYDATFDPPLGEPGYPRVLTKWRRPYRTLDGHVCVLPYSNKDVQRFCVFAGWPELAHDKRFRDIPARLRNIDAFYSFVAEVLAARTTQACVDGLRAVDVPCAPVKTLQELMSDEHLQAVGFFQMQDHPTEGRVRQCALPMYFSDSPASVRLPAPRLGEHGREVLLEAGYSGGEIEQLVGSGVVRLAG